MTDNISTTISLWKYLLMYLFYVNIWTLQYVHYLHCTLLYTKYTTACKLGKISVLLLMKKDPSLSCKASGRALLPRLLRNWRPNAAYSTPMTNALKESTTGCWPRIYFFQCRVVVTGWQLTADRISAAGYLRGWHQLAGVVLILLGVVVCGYTHML